MDILGIVLLAVSIEGLITYLFGKRENENRSWLKYLSLTLGILVSFAYKVDIIAMTGLISSHPAVGYIMSGLIIGRGANYLNDILALIKGKSAEVTKISIPTSVASVTTTTSSTASEVL